MIMETISCGYPVAPSGLGSTAISPPASPLGPEGNYAPQLYAPTPFVQPSFSGSPLHHGSYPAKYDEDANNNNHIFNSNLNHTHHNKNDNNHNNDSLLNGLASLNLSEPEDRYSDLSPVSETSGYLSQSPPPSPAVVPPSSRSKPKKTSRSKAKSSLQSEDGDEKKGRKDSFVYDVRLPDDQFLFFVPDLDLVKSHLMFAVREEVDVLKDRIVELMERIKHLECENTILRQYASPEVLQQIQPQMPLPMAPHHSSTS